MKSAFSKELMRCLIEKYGRMPSAASFARDFNLRAKDVQPISSETARRWIRGLSMPEFDRLKILIDWVGLQVSFMREIHLSDQEPSKNMAISVGAHSPSGLPAEEIELLRLFRSCDEGARRTFLAVASAIHKSARG